MNGAQKLAHKSSQKGMTLIEVMISLAIFAIFVTAYMSSQGNNLLDSQNMRSEAKLRTLCQQVMNETITHPPKLRESLTLKPEKKNFKDHENYRYEIEYRQLEIEEILRSLTAPKDGQNYRPEQVKRRKMQEQINKRLAKNMKKLVWQVMVTVFNKTTGESFSLSTFLYNPEAHVDLGSI